MNLKVWFSPSKYDKPSRLRHISYRSGRPLCDIAIIWSYGISGLQILFIVCTAVSIQVIHKFLTAWTPST